MNFRTFFIICTSFFILSPVSFAQLTTGFTFSRQNGQSNSSFSSTKVLGTSRVLGNSCKDQFRSLYSKNNIKNATNQGCIILPENVVSLPSQSGEADKFKIIDTSRAFGISDSTSSKVINESSSQKAVNNFSGFGYSVFTLPR